MADADDAAFISNEDRLLLNAKAYQWYGETRGTGPYHLPTVGRFSLSGGAYHFRVHFVGWGTAAEKYQQLVAQLTRWRLGIE